MKKITLSLAVMFCATLFFTSCGGPEADGKKMAKYTCEMTQLTKKAMGDTPEAKEAKDKLDKLQKEMEEFGKEMDKKYAKDDTTSQKKAMMAYEEEMKNCKE